VCLVGLEDTYAHDGRVITEPLYQWAVPRSLAAHQATWLRLARSYTQLNAPFGEFSKAILSVSTTAIASGASGADSTYATLEARIAGWTDERDALAAQIRTMLNASEFDGDAINEQQAKSLTAQSDALVKEVVTAAD
jgi:hypothetical protein